MTVIASVFCSGKWGCATQLGFDFFGEERKIFKKLNQLLDLFFCLCIIEKQHILKVRCVLEPERNPDKLSVSGHVLGIRWSSLGNKEEIPFRYLFNSDNFIRHLKYLNTWLKRSVSKISHWKIQITTFLFLQQKQQ